MLKTALLVYLSKLNCLSAVILKIQENGDRSFLEEIYTVARASHHDETYGNAMVYSSPILENDCLVGTRGIVMDITEHKKAGVAHEINNPIGYVSGNLTTLE